MKEYSINSQPPPVRREEDSRKPIAGYFLRNGCRICNAASFHCTQWLVQPLSPCFVYWAGGHIICSPGTIANRIHIGRNTYRNTARPNRNCTEPLFFSDLSRTFQRKRPESTVTRRSLLSKSAKIQHILSK